MLNIYPVKFSVEERYNKEDTYAYVTITVGKIPKEALSITGISKSKDSEKLPLSGVTSFDINIAVFVKIFNREQGIIIKNLPDGLLNEKQKGFKEKIKQNDIEKEKKISELKSQIKQIKNEIDSIEYDKRNNYVKDALLYISYRLCGFIND